MTILAIVAGICLCSGFACCFLGHICMSIRRKAILIRHCGDRNDLNLVFYPRSLNAEGLKYRKLVMTGWALLGIGLVAGIVLLRNFNGGN